MFYGMKFYNDQLMEAGPFGNVQSEVLFQKDNTFTFKQGWAFPRKVYFNGDECMLPLPETYPFLPNSAHQNLLAFSTFISSVIFLLVTVWWLSWLFSKSSQCWNSDTSFEAKATSTWNTGTLSQKSFEENNKAKVYTYELESRGRLDLNSNEISVNF